MIEEVSGNILAADAEALVNTVNTVGVMGKGIALQFKQAFPDNFRAYKTACEQKRVQMGRMFVYDTGRLSNPRYIINFPTKKHWRSNSQLSDIDHGLIDLVRVLNEYEITSVAVPALGCGNGGLPWSAVRPRIFEALSKLTGVDVRVYPPGGAPAAKDMPVGTEAPSITRGRAALLELMRRYMRMVELETFIAPKGVSLLEIQKLTYFLQVAGEDLRLDFHPAKYGPYAEKLNFVLQRIEGHYLRGYGDRSEQILKLQPIEILPGAIEVARNWTNTSAPDLEHRFSELEDLIGGFASPYGLELLSTVHWVATHSADQESLADEEIIVRVQAWSRRKKELFTPKHILSARRRLLDNGWIKNQPAVIR